MCNLHSFFTKLRPLCKILGSSIFKLTLPNTYIESRRDHPYITSAKGLGGWGQKMSIFADVQYCIYANIVGGSEKSPKICWRNIGMIPSCMPFLSCKREEHGVEIGYQESPILESLQFTLLFYQIEPLRNGPSLVLPSNLSGES